MSRET
jgi:hypothetical protein